MLKPQNCNHSHIFALENFETRNSALPWKNLNMVPRQDKIARKESSNNRMSQPLNKMIYHYPAGFSNYPSFSPLAKLTLTALPPSNCPTCSVTS